MEFKTTKTDEANAVITATITDDKIQALIDKLAKQIAKSVDIQGFRKGKVPLAIVKQRFAQKLTQDAQGEAIKELFNKSLEELQIDKLSIIGDFKRGKYDRNSYNTSIFWCVFYVYFNIWCIYCYYNVIKICWW